MSDGVVIYGTGSPILVDVLESLHRAKLVVRAGVRNVDSQSYLDAGIPEITPDAIREEMTAWAVVVPLFSPGNRQRAVREAQSHGLLRTINLIDASIAMPRRIQCGEGVYINAGCSIGAASAFGDYVFVNRGASIGHHARLGRFASVGPGAVVAGGAIVEDGGFVGAGATILPSRVVGRNAVVGAGSVVTQDVPPHAVVVGNPARVIKTDIAGYNGVAVE